MNSVPAQEIKRCGISAVDDALLDGPVHVIKNNRPQYVILSEERYAELVAIRQESDRASLRASLEDLKAGRVNRYQDVDTLMRQLDRSDAE